MKRRSKYLKFSVTPGEKSLIEYSAKICGELGINWCKAAYIRENELNTALSIIQGELVRGADIKLPEEVVEELFTEDMKQRYRTPVEERRRQHEEWLENVKAKKREPNDQCDHSSG